MRKLLLAIMAVSTLAGYQSTAITKKVLFIGNSYTFTNNMPAIVDSIARSFGDTLIYDVSAPGGYTLQQHTTNLTTISKINARQWDVVMIHEQSQRPAFPPSQVASDVYPFATRLDSMVRANDTCTQTMFMMTWGRANGDQANCAGYPVICTYSGMQMRLRESYLQMATDNRADVAPVGMAFRIMMDSAYAPWLYSPDSSHPSMAGSYLEACVIYSSVFHKSTRNSTYMAGLVPPDVALLQRVATKVVFDSLSLWQGTGHYPYAGFTKNNANPYNFRHQSPVAARHTWAFGDGGTDTAANPVHIYMPGLYTVSHTVTTNCFTETMTDSVRVPVGVGVTNINDDNEVIKILSFGSGKVAFNLLTHGTCTLEIYDMRGRKVRVYNAGTRLINDEFAPGLYIYKLINAEEGSIVTGKLSIF